MYDLPDGWEWKELISLTDIFSDGDWIESKDQSEDGIRLIQTGNVGIGLFKDREDKSRYISKETFERLNCTEIFENDCLISRLPEPVGRSCLIPKMNSKMITSVDCTIIRFNKKILPKFFVYYSQLNYYFNMIMNNATGATRLRISKKNLSKIPVPIPALEEQKRIVAKLDILFAKIDKAIALHQKNIDEVNVFMASVLNDVFVELEEKYGLIEVGKVTDCIVPQRNKPKQFIGNIPWITTDDLELFKRISKSTKGLGLRMEDIEEVKSKIFPKDSVLMSCVGDLGIVAIADDEIVVNQQLHTYQCKDNLVNTFLMYALYVKKDFMYQIANITTVAYMNKSKCNSIPIPLPPLKTQQKVVSYLDEISQKMEKIKQIQKEKMESLKALKASILDQAFKGEL